MGVSPELKGISRGLSLENSGLTRQREGALFYALDGHLWPQVFESLQRYPFQLVGVEPVHRVCAQVSVRLFGFEGCVHQVDCEGNGVSRAEELGQGICRKFSMKARRTITFCYLYN